MADAGGGADDKKEETGSPEELTSTLSSTASSQESTSEMLLRMMRNLGLRAASTKTEPVLDEFSLDGIVKYIKDKNCKNIVTMAGAGISTSAGIPDFRSPGTGLYDNLQKYDLPSPQSVFDIGFFRENPEPFFKLAKELWPGTFKPTPCHYFIKMLKDKGLLLRHFTQNIDTLEHVSGLDPTSIVEAHGTFFKSHCLACRKEYTMEWMKEEIFSDRIPTCTKDDCDGVVKPDIVFFGEVLPDKFFQCVQNDLPLCDLLIILGTSLVVHPFASLVNQVPDSCPRLYINMEKPAEESDPFMAMLGMGNTFNFGSEDNYRDVFWEGSCDDGCLSLAEKLGWGKELKETIGTEHKRIDSEIAENTKTTAENKSAKSQNDPSTSSTEKSPKL